jgi:hypothetical protein
MMHNEVQLKLNQLLSPLSDIPIALGLWSMALSGYEVTTEIL